MQYVAFLDVLGFSNKVLNNFEDTIEQYQLLINSWNFHYEHANEVPLTIYSDSLLLTSPNLAHITEAVNTLQMLTMWNDCLLRGGIAFGKHVELRDGSNTYVVSEALTLAAKTENEVSHPCISLHESVTVPDTWWNPNIPNLHRRVFFFDGLRIVNPFNIVWYRSASVRVSQLAIDSPAHKKKFDWFLALHEAVSSKTPLIPTQM
ncbi:hypothetical protein [Geothrix alkalitolerans]|uniref:hypothetical protein n=1 Tax=Geothrix alkalitolerans TaxID=2922724 RepID=UPI001FAEF2E6|nr:hypothetical protein [Geothrix alkalitolerans]